MPLEIENKLRSIFTNEEEYEFIKTESQKSPFYFTKEFLSLYDELKEEKRISGEEVKYLDAELSDNE